MDMTASKWGTYGRRDSGAFHAPEMTVRKKIGLWGLRLPFTTTLNAAALRTRM